MDQFYVPTEIQLGRGALAALGTQTARFGARAMVVCGAGFARRSGLLDRALAALQRAGITATTFDAVRGEANLAVVEEGITIARQQAVEVVIGLGGGSALDTAKAIASAAPLEGSIWEYHGGRAIEAAPPSPPLPRGTAPRSPDAAHDPRNGAHRIRATAGSPAWPRTRDDPHAGYGHWQRRLCRPSGVYPSANAITDAWRTGPSLHRRPPSARL